MALAFNVVHREAVRVAAEQAALRTSVSAMFLNLARRSQTLVDRMIGELDAIERGEEDPKRLAQLFELDHLATRMRRNDENLLVLAGADSAAPRRDDALVVDVLRAAQSEVELYNRIEFGTVDTDISVAAHAVNDVVRLVAELLDNATRFSPPNTTVVADGRRIRDYVLIQIEDRGLGLTDEQLDSLNRRLAAAAERRRRRVPPDGSGRGEPARLPLRHPGGVAPQRRGRHRRPGDVARRHRGAAQQPGPRSGAHPAASADGRGADAAHPGRSRRAVRRCRHRRRRRCPTSGGPARRRPPSGSRRWTRGTPPRPCRRGGYTGPRSTIADPRPPRPPLPYPRRRHPRPRSRRPGRPPATAAGASLGSRDRGVPDRRPAAPARLHRGRRGRRRRARRPGPPGRAGRRAGRGGTAGRARRCPPHRSAPGPTSPPRLRSSGRWRRSGSGRTATTPPRSSPGPTSTSRPRPPPPLRPRPGCAPATAASRARRPRRPRRRPDRSCRPAPRAAPAPTARPRRVPDGLGTTMDGFGTRPSAPPSYDPPPAGRPAPAAAPAPAPARRPRPRAPGVRRPTRAGPGPAGLPSRLTAGTTRSGSAQAGAAGTARAGWHRTEERPGPQPADPG